MFDEHGVVQTINHPNQGKGDDAEYQHLAICAHAAPPSRRPVYRTTPTSIPTRAMITSRPPMSAMPPATRPNFNSSKTKTGRITEPASSIFTQRLFQRSLRKTYGCTNET